MSVEAGLCQLLIGTPSIVGAIPGGIFPVILPESTKTTSATYRVISSVPTYTLGAEPMTTTRIEYTAWASTYALAKAATDAIRTTLDRYSGTLPNNVNVALCWRAGAEVDDFDADRRMYTSSIDFRLTHSL